MSEMEETKEYFKLINIGRFLPMPNEARIIL